MENRFLNQWQSQHSQGSLSFGILGALDQIWMLCLALDQQLKRHSTRRQLIELDTDLLRDVGITHTQRESELKKFFWQR